MRQGMRTVRAGALLLLSLSSGTAAAAPGEVQNLRFENSSQLRWDEQPTADYYHLYRGYARQLSSGFLGTALEGEITQATYAEPTIPFRGHCFFYLVTAANSNGEGDLGFGTSALGEPVLRSNPHPWPGLGVMGRWEDLQPWPVQAVHASPLPDGQILTWGPPSFSGSTFGTTSDVWDPSTGAHQASRVDANIFCAGHSLLPDGRVVVAGGQITQELGPNYTFVFNGSTLSWERGPDMRRGRYYPTTTRLPDGSIMIFSGLDENHLENPDVEIFRANDGLYAIDLLEQASRSVAFYPRMHLLPNGRVVQVGQGWSTWTLDLETQTWTLITNASEHRAEGTSVLLPSNPWRIMSLGGAREGQGHDPTSEGSRTAEIIDLSQSVPRWRYTAPMHFGRMHHNAVILPDGKILVIGGDTRFDAQLVMYTSEIFDPATETWTVAATQKSHRIYHSTALLLPDGRVMSAGSNFNLTAEFYSPGYLFRGPRPLLDSAPDSINYSEEFRVTTPDATRVVSAALIHPGAVTHSFAMDQRFVPLPIRSQPGSIVLAAPAHPALAPPGHYMLFLVDSEGVPSVAKIVLLSAP